MYRIHRLLPLSIVAVNAEDVTKRDFGDNGRVGIRQAKKAVFCVHILHMVKKLRNRISEKQDTNRKIHFFISFLYFLQVNYNAKSLICQYGCLDYYSLNIIKGAGAPYFYPSIISWIIYSASTIMAIASGSITVTSPASQEKPIDSTLPSLDGAYW